MNIFIDDSGISEQEHEPIYFTRSGINYGIRDFKQPNNSIDPGQGKGILKSFYSLADYTKQIPSDLNTSTFIHSKNILPNRK